MTSSRVDVDLVPAHRLGGVLRAARRSRGFSHSDLVARTGGVVSEALLAAAEQGHIRIQPAALETVAVALGVEIRELVPARAELVIDLDAGTISTRGGTRRYGSDPDPDEILVQYLALVHTLRGVEPGTPIPLRDVDLAVLSQALTVEAGVVRTKLVTLMGEPPDLIRRTRHLSRKLVVPAAGILVGATAVGALVFVLADGDDAADTGSHVGQAVVVEGDVELAPPLVAERDETGRVVVSERTPDPADTSRAPDGDPTTGDDDPTGVTPGTVTGPTADAELIDPEVVVRGPDGEAVPLAEPELIPPLVVERDDAPRDFD